MNDERFLFNLKFMEVLFIFDSYVWMELGEVYMGRLFLAGLPKLSVLNPFSKGCHSVPPLT